MDNNASRHWLKEPLFHFLLIGACLFGLYGLINPDALQDDRTIVVDQNRIDLIKTRFDRTWNRPPTDKELNGLINDFIVEEIFYRQALAMGLDSDDAVIRRRLRQKMEFLTADSADLLTPTEAELDQYRLEHPQQFRRDPVFSFEQVYIATDTPSLEIRVHQIQQQLAAGDQVEGSASLLPRSFNQVSAFQVDRHFGTGFAEDLEALPLNQWSKPLRSGLGLHFIKITHYQPGYLPALAEIRPQVKREWQEAKHRQLKTAMLENLKDNYTIVIERPDTDNNLSVSPDQSI